MFCTAVLTGALPENLSLFAALLLPPEIALPFVLMTLQQFHCLPAKMQQQMVKQSGVHLFSRTGVGVNLMLYQVEGFYVEIYFDKQLSKVLRLRCFDDTRNLDPYLRLVDVSELQQFFP
jgi:hypothetical protein